MPCFHSLDLDTGSTASLMEVCIEDANGTARRSRRRGAH